MQGIHLIIRSVNRASLFRYYNLNVTLIRLILRPIRLVAITTQTYRAPPYTVVIFPRSAAKEPWLTQNRSTDSGALQSCVSRTPLIPPLR